MTTETPFVPELSFPEAEAECLREAYQQAKVILEYGSGGSTVLAADLPGKLIFSVESDLVWAHNLQRYIDNQKFLSPAIVFPVDIGPVGEWGRPLDCTNWYKFYRYPLDIWEQQFFRHPDVVLIDGRFRAACMVTVKMKIKRPVKVLFDDYINRPIYHEVEKIVGSPAHVVGRMAVFVVEPDYRNLLNLTSMLNLMSQTTYAGKFNYSCLTTT